MNESTLENLSILDKLGAEDLLHYVLGGTSDASNPSCGVGELAHDLLAMAYNAEGEFTGSESLAPHLLNLVRRCEAIDVLVRRRVLGLRAELESAKACMEQFEREHQAEAAEFEREHATEIAAKDAELLALRTEFGQRGEIIEEAQRLVGEKDAELADLRTKLAGRDEDFRQLEAFAKSQTTELRATKKAKPSNGARR